MCEGPGFSTIVKHMSRTIEFDDVCQVTVVREGLFLIYEHVSCRYIGNWFRSIREHAAMNVISIQFLFKNFKYSLQPPTTDMS